MAYRSEHPADPQLGEQDRTIPGITPTPIEDTLISRLEFRNALLWARLREIHHGPLPTDDGFLDGA